MLTPAWAATPYIVDPPFAGMLSFVDERAFMKALSKGDYGAFWAACQCFFSGVA
jgi:hypothetical protein